MNQDLDIVYAWASEPKQQVCGGFSDGSCPTTKGSYCVDCHVTAFNALQRVRTAIVNGLVALAL